MRKDLSCVSLGQHGGLEKATTGFTEFVQVKRLVPWPITLPFCVRGLRFAQFKTILFKIATLHAYFVPGCAWAMDLETKQNPCQNGFLGKVWGANHAFNPYIYITPGPHKCLHNAGDALGGCWKSCC
eukprot:1159696-Pelagomonas_calceolata.AAC.17